MNGVQIEQKSYWLVLLYFFIWQQQFFYWRPNECSCWLGRQWDVGLFHAFAMLHKISNKIPTLNEACRVEMWTKFAEGCSWKPSVYMWKSLVFAVELAFDIWKFILEKPNGIPIIMVWKISIPCINLSLYKLLLMQ